MVLVSFLQDTQTFQPEIHDTGQNDYDDMASIMKAAESSCSKPVEASTNSETREAECLNADLDNRIYHKMNLRVDNYKGTYHTQAI